MRNGNRTRMSDGMMMLFALCAPGFSHAVGAQDPVYNGRPLSSWLDHHVPSSSARPPYGTPGWHQAHEAIRSIGSNAIPTLLNMLRAKDKPDLAIEAIQKARELGLPLNRYRYATELHQEAEYAFEILGTNGLGAVPELIKIYDQEISPSSQSAAANSLGNIARHLRSGAEAALPILIERFNHTNREVRFYAVSAVANIRGDPVTAIPALTTALQDSHVSVRWNALVGLSNYGGKARSAVPEILKLLDDPGMVGDNSIIEQVETALWRIAPETVGYPLVVEENSPMVRDGEVVLSLKVTLRGEAKVLVPSGMSVPLVRQYWSSSPRPSVKLYRENAVSGSSDQFLGEFEVLNLPEEEQINVSTLVVVVGDKILLCARDNTNDVFLPIRRIETDP